MDVNQLRELIKMVEEADVSEVTIEEGDSKITVRRGGVVAAPAAGPEAAPAAAPAAAPEAAPAASAGDRPASWKSVVAPMVGTFYEAPSPSSPAFVQVGDSFSEGQTLCILEAMKLMNEIQAEEAGTVTEIAVANGDAVEYGTVLFYYESA